MPKRDADLLIEDIETAITRIEGYIAGLDREAFLQDQKTIDAVVRNLEIIGEAVRWLPSEFKEQHGSVPWSQIAGCGTGSCMIISASTWRSSGRCSKRLYRNSNVNLPAFVPDGCKGRRDSASRLAEKHFARIRCGSTGLRHSESHKEPRAKNCSCNEIVAEQAEDVSDLKHRIFWSSPDLRN